uniref:ribosomal protein S11 n=1 Tax=Drosera capensis TaxID=4366 RepID=UPI002411196C|nr:ribosomal protein S11 [Drosera capensis]WEQ03458.1 ribosomal protein S11 [Drosera capensis]
MAKPILLYSPRKGSRKNARTARIIIPRGIIYVQANLNNTTVTVTNVQGGVVCWASAGTCRFEGRQKKTPFAAESVARKVIGLVSMKEAEVRIKGSNRGRNIILRALRKSGLFIRTIKNVTPRAHNGCRPARKKHG